MHRLFVVLFLGTVVQSADHGTFKDCSRVDFCKNLRGKTSESQYYSNADGAGLQDDNQAVVVSLQNRNGGSSLILTINGLEDDTFRVSIAETDSKRYQLDVVLAQDPVPIPYDFCLVVVPKFTISLQV